MPSRRCICLGSSREGRDIVGYRIGGGGRSVSLIAGCHADEPVGPAMLDRLAAWLLDLPDSRLLSSPSSPGTWYRTPTRTARHRNARWTSSVFGAGASPIGPEAGVDAGRYLSRAVREPPGDDVEFGFPSR